MAIRKITIMGFSTIAISLGISLTIVGARIEIHTFVLVGIVGIITGLVSIKPFARVVLRHLDSRDDQLT